jgi:anaerobic dimethyl sulfoxide reductase subunit B
VGSCSLEKIALKEGVTLVQIGFYINQSICSGCKGCTVACKDKNDSDVDINFRRVYSYEEGSYDQNSSGILPTKLVSYYFSIACNHCSNPKCLPSCPTGAIEKREKDGVVVIHQDICVGARFCVKACPYGAPQFNPNKFKSNKCNFCIDLLDKGEDPACVSTCRMKAIEYGPLEELRKKYGKINTIIGMPSGKITDPSLVITPHRDAL